MNSARRRDDAKPSDLSRTQETDVTVLCAGSHPPIVIPETAKPLSGTSERSNPKRGVLGTSSRLFGRDDNPGIVDPAYRLPAATMRAPSALNSAAQRLNSCSSKTRA